MRSALDQVSDQEHGNQGDCEYATKYFHAKSLAQGGMPYNCLRSSQFCQQPYRHCYCPHMRCDGSVAQPIQHDPDLLFAGIRLAPLSSILRIDCRASVRALDVCDALLAGALRCLTHRPLLGGYDE